MDKYLITVFRSCRVVLHLAYGLLLAIPYPKLHPDNRQRILKAWSRQLLEIFNIRIHVEGPSPANDGKGCLLVANHVSWLDIFALNAIHPARFIAKSEVRQWPLIGWLSERGGTLYLERTSRQKASTLNQHLSTMLKRGDCIGLFPEGTTSDGKQVGHFHSALFQPAIEAEAVLLPVALRYLDERGKLNPAAAFTGDTTLVESIWHILSCRETHLLMILAPTLMVTGENRRTLAHTTQERIAQGLQQADLLSHHLSTLDTPDTFTKFLLSTRSIYSLLISPVMNRIGK